MALGPGERRIDVRTPWPGAAVLFKERTGSTMDDARRLAGEGWPSGTTVVAAYQERGRGRLGRRSWRSAAGQNLLFTVLLRLPPAGAPLPEGSPPPAPLTRLPVLAGLSVALALEELFGLNPLVKWPNDVLASAPGRTLPGEARPDEALASAPGRTLPGEARPNEALARGRKLCGVLGESFHGAVLIGIGLNCNQPEFPGEIAARAVSLRQLLGWEVELPAILERILAHLHAELSDPHWRTRLEERLYLRGRQVQVLEDAEAPPGGMGRPAARQGRLVGLADDGALLLQPDSGTGDEARAPVRIYAGELQELPGLPR